MVTFAEQLKQQYVEMDVLPDEDWPPSVGRKESNLVMIEHERDTLPGAKEAEEMQRDYVGGRVDRIVKKKKEIGYDQLFSFLKEKCRSKFKMLIDGAPGVGKTTLCRKFCKDWGAGQILQQFSIVWLLNLRQEKIAKAKSLDDLFQHDDEDLLKEIVQHMKKTRGEGNLLVCDGFDELSEKERTEHSLFLDIIRGDVLPNCSVIVSSRPYASLELQQMNSIAHHVEIVGFTEEQVKACIRRNITDKPKATKLIKHLKQRLDILSLCYTPLNAAITLYVYKQEEYTLPTTLTQLYTLYILHSLKRSVRIHFKNLNVNHITDLKNLPHPIALPFKALCKMAYNGLHDDQLGFSTSQLPKSLQGCPGCKGTKPDLLGLMSGSKGFTRSNAEVSYQFTHLTVQEFLAAWYADIVKKQGKVFLEKAGVDRFRMMLLFLAGITGLQDTQVYQQVLNNAPRPSIFFLSHLIYESQSICLSSILANAVQQNGELTMKFNRYDLFQCTVVAYFLSTCNFPWKHLKLVYVTDEQMKVVYQVCCEHAGSSDVRGAQKINPLKDTQELSLRYVFDDSTPSPKHTSFSYLRHMKPTSLLVSFAKATVKSISKYCSMLFNVLKNHKTLQRLEIMAMEECAFDIEECEGLKEMLKTNTSLQNLLIGWNILNDLTAEHIAAGLDDNHSLKKLDIR